MATGSQPQPLSSGGVVFPVPPRAGVALVVSFVFALTVLGLSLHDLGRASLYLNPVVCAFTIVHHLALFTLAIRHFDFSEPRPHQLPLFFTHAAHICCLALLGLAWLAVAISIALTGNLSDPHFIGGADSLLDGAFRIDDPVLAQSIIGVLESLALSALASMCFAGRIDHCAEDPEGSIPSSPPPGSPTKLPTSPPPDMPEKPLPAAPANSKRKSRPPTWNYLTSFATPMRKSLLPPSRKARTSRRIPGDVV
ncbi:hypothetical protein EXIGLDRAFT_720237 [Exidia glandulosa HHB12029]|uniref:Uncharacterized protein n=1 Tax=Exidia glandulosa HHB12029 TaxID=1314781 RepID=A0A165GHX1_EXIGL|nr:hypothetical protein EXIGLDRAFT_720237 [Exidia glandulosa HHB12029]